MTAARDEGAPAADLEMLERATSLVRSAFQSDGRIEVMGFVATRAGATPAMRMVTTPGLRTVLERRNFADALRHLSIRSASPCSAVAYDARIMEGAASKGRAVGRRGAAGKSAKAGEAVIIAVESDAGRTELRLSVTRQGNGRIDVDADQEPVFTQRCDAGARPDDELRDFHVPTMDRINPSVVAWAAQMDRHADRMLDGRP